MIPPGLWAAFSMMSRVLSCLSDARRTGMCLIYALFIANKGIRVPSSAPKSNEESQDSSWDFLFIRHLHGLCMVFASPPEIISW